MVGDLPLKKMTIGPSSTSETLFSKYFSPLQEPRKIEKVKIVLQTDKKIKQIASIYKDVSNFFYLGKGYNFLVALEGALKLNLEGNP